MNKRIIYPNQTDGVTVLAPALNWTGTIEELATKDVPSGMPYKIVDISEIPSDRTFRNAWEFSPEGVTVNSDKAKAIWKNHWREARKPKLAALDVEFMKAVEIGDTTRQALIAEQKQALRDVTQTPIEGTSPEEIKAVWPEILN